MCVSNACENTDMGERREKVKEGRGNRLRAYVSHTAELKIDWTLEKEKEKEIFNRQVLVQTFMLRLYKR